MILRGATSLRGALEGVGPENRDFFGPWNGIKLRIKKIVAIVDLGTWNRELLNPLLSELKHFRHESIRNSKWISETYIIEKPRCSQGLWLQVQA
jgi:hypothetical protein